MLNSARRSVTSNHVNEAGVGSSAAKLFTLKISLCNCARLLNTAEQQLKSQFNCVDEIQIEIRSERKSCRQRAVYMS